MAGHLERSGGPAFLQVSATRFTDDQRGGQVEALGGKGRVCQAAEHGLKSRIGNLATGLMNGCEGHRYQHGVFDIIKSDDADAVRNVSLAIPGCESAWRRRPAAGPLFSYLRKVRPGDRASEFRQRVMGLGIKGVTLHSYRYTWAERALKCGNPERFAQQALGHNSKAVHHAYAKHAEVTVPSLDEWEKQWKENPQQITQPKVLPVNFRAGSGATDNRDADAESLGFAQWN